MAEESDRLNPPFDYAIDFNVGSGDERALKIYCKLKPASNLIDAMIVCSLCHLQKKVQEDNGIYFNAECTGIYEQGGMAILRADNKLILEIAKNLASCYHLE